LSSIRFYTALLLRILLVHYISRTTNNSSSCDSGNSPTEGASSSKKPVSRKKEFGNMLFNLSKEIGKDELISLKRLCGSVYDLIPKGDLEKMEQAYDVFQFLREDMRIAIDNTELLEQLLKEIRRKDLVEKYIKPFVSK
ncbi:caspase-8-like, partial [Saccoglossus kowalevskii]